MSPTEAAVAAGTRRKTKALVVPLAGLGAALFLPPLLAGLPVAGQRALIVTLITILLWTGEILAPGVAALLSVSLLALSGATGTLRDALQGFANPVPFFLIGVLTMGVAVVRSGVAERLARTILERARGSSLAVYLQLVLSFPVMTPAAVGDDPLGDPHPHLRRGLHARTDPARCGRGQGRHAGALLDQPARVDLAPDRRDHAGHERRDHRRYVVDGLVRADGGALLRDPSPGRRPHVRALSPRLHRGAADARARAPSADLGNGVADDRDHPERLGPVAHRRSPPSRSGAPGAARLRRAPHAGPGPARLDGPRARCGMVELLRDRRLDLAGPRPRLERCGAVARSAPRRRATRVRRQRPRRRRAPDARRNRAARDRAEHLRLSRPGAPDRDVGRA